MEINGNKVGNLKDVIKAYVEDGCHLSIG